MDIERVRGLILKTASSIADDALNSGYRARPEKFRVDETDGTFEVYENYGITRTDWWLFQTIKFDEGQLTEVSFPESVNGFRWNRDNGSIELLFDEVDRTYQRYHALSWLLDRNGIGFLSETSGIGGQIILKVEYAYELYEEEIKFILAGVFLWGHSSDLKLNEQDVIKFLPNGRIIPLDGLLRFMIDPTRFNVMFRNSSVPSLSDFEGFVKIDRHNSSAIPVEGKHKCNGRIYPIEDTNEWLAFVTHGNVTNEVGRALIVNVDRQNVKVVEVNGVPTIVATAWVDGIRYDLVIPELRYSPVEITSENEFKAIQIHEHDGKRYGLIPITVNHLKDTIDYYWSDVVGATIAEHLGFK